jgi:hypothetical protein
MIVKSARGLVILFAFACMLAPVWAGCYAALMWFVSAMSANVDSLSAVVMFIAIVLMGMMAAALG